MSGNRAIAGQLLLCVLTALAAGPAAAQDALARELRTCEALTFYLDFEGTVDAAMARGNPEPRQPRAVRERACYVAGVNGRGLLVGDGRKYRFEYETEGNLDQRRGTVSMWVNGESWDFSESPTPCNYGFWYTWRTAQELTSFHLRKCRYRQGVTFEFILLGTPTPPFESKRFSAKSSTLTPVEGLHAVAGRWYHLAATWEMRKLTLYCNGDKADGGRLSWPLGHLGPVHSVFTVGPWPPPEEKTVIDELRIHDRALSEQEIVELMTLDVR